MNAMAVAQRMTADAYLAIPYDGVRSQLVEGEVVVQEPTRPHQRVQHELAYELETWIRAEPGRGVVSLPIDVLIDERNVFGPDLLWYAQGRAPAPDAKPPYPLPNLAVEIRSPSTWRYDIGAKKSAYERSGLPELWLVDIDADVVLAFRRSAPRSVTFDLAVELGRDDALGSPLLPGFALALGTLFAS